jgi:hypothetical protein
LRKQRHDAFNAGQNFVVPKAKHSKFVYGKPPIANLIPWRFGVLSAIHFNDKSRFEANEVRNERPNRNLASKLEIREPPIAQRIPQFPLRVGHA